MDVFKFVIRRLATMLLTLLLVSALIFLIINLPPGDYLSNQIAGQGRMVSRVFCKAILAGHSSLINRCLKLLAAPCG